VLRSFHSVAGGLTLEFSGTPLSGHGTLPRPNRYGELRIFATFTPVASSTLLDGMQQGIDSGSKTGDCNRKTRQLNFMPNPIATYGY
jgi:hypothetical protein